MDSAESAAARNEKLNISPKWRVSLLLGVLLSAYALRLTYALEISPGVDEYIAMTAVNRTLQTGTPQLAAGLYDHGILFVYLDALWVSLAGETWLAARFVSIMCGVIIVALAFRIGQEWFSARAGILAAAIVTLIPEMIARGAHVRMHALLQLLLLVALFGLYQGLVLGDNRKMRLVGAAALACAPFAHLLAIPLTGPLIVGLVASRWWTAKWGSAPRPSWRFPWAESALLVLGITCRWLLQGASGPWGVEGRVWTDPGMLLDPVHIITGIVGWSFQFITWPFLVLTVLIVAGGLGMIVRLARRNSLPDDVSRVYLALSWLGSLGGLAIFSTMYSPGYVVPLLPFWALLAAAELDLFIRQVELALPRRTTELIGALGALAVVAALILPFSLDMATRTQLAIREAYSLVRVSLGPSDVVLASSPPAARLELGRVDYYAQPNGVSSDGPGGRSGIWLGTPLIDSEEALEEILNSGRRVWLVVDQEGWGRHYPEWYKARVAQRMHLAGEFAGMLVFTTS